MILKSHVSVMMSSKSQCTMSLTGMIQQADPSFASELSPTSPLLSPQNSTSQTPLLQQAQPPPGYQSPDIKNWQQGAMGNNRYAV